MYTVRTPVGEQRYKAQVQYIGAEFRARFVPVQYHTIIAATGRAAEWTGQDGRRRRDGLLVVSAAEETERTVGRRKVQERARQGRQTGPDTKAGQEGRKQARRTRRTMASRRGVDKHWRLELPMLVLRLLLLLLLRMVLPAAATHCRCCCLYLPYLSGLPAAPTLTLWSPRVPTPGLVWCGLQNVLVAGGHTPRTR